MQIITKGMVVPGILGTWWLVDDKGNSTTRLSGDWVEQYAGQELGIVSIDKPIDILFDIIAEMQAKKEEAEMKSREEEYEVAESGLSDPLEGKEDV